MRVAGITSDDGVPCTVQVDRTVINGDSAVHLAVAKGYRGTFRHEDRVEIENCCLSKGAAVLIAHQLLVAADCPAAAQDLQPLVEQVDRSLIIGGAS